MSRIFVKPGRKRADGSAELVRRAHKPGFVAPEGEWMPDSSYVRRRIKSGCLVRCEPASPKPAASSTKKTAPPRED